MAKTRRRVRGHRKRSRIAAGAAASGRDGQQSLKRCDHRFRRWNGMSDIELLPGLNDLWARTLGDRRICVAVLDGVADLTHPCFEGGDVTQLATYWRPATTASEDFAIHATHVASVIFGQH